MDNSKQAIAMEMAGSYTEDIYRAFIHIYGIREALSEGVNGVDYRYKGYFCDYTELIKKTLKFEGTLLTDMPSYIHIDWEKTTDSLRDNYSNKGKHYFSNNKILI